MAFDLTNGYQPRTFEEILQAMTDEVNTQFGTTYDTTTIIGTEFYKFFYGGVQLVMQSESYTAEITARMTDYIRTANENINLPKSTIDGFTQGLLRELELNSTIKDITDPAEAGYLFLVVDADDGDHATGNATITNYANLVSGTDDSITVGGVVFTAQTGAATLGTATFQAATSNNATAASLALQINSHATTSPLVKATAIGAVVNLRTIQGGTAGNSITLAYTDNDTNIGATVSGATLSGGTTNADYATTKQAIIDRMHNWLSAALYYTGSETGTKTAINGQSFTYKYALPTPVDILVRITATTSANAKTPILNENQIRDIFDANFAELYRIGLDFEPEKYLEIARDLPFASNILLEYSEDAGATWDDQPRAMAYNEKIIITAPATISVV
jgi:hypothetical protein